MRKNANMQFTYYRQVPSNYNTGSFIITVIIYCILELFIMLNKLNIEFTSVWLRKVLIKSYNYSDYLKKDNMDILLESLADSMWNERFFLELMINWISILVIIARYVK